MESAAEFFFAKGTHWTTLVEIRLDDKHRRSAGNIDIVLVSYDTSGRVLDFGALEIQAVYISGNIRRPFSYYMEDPSGRSNMDWTGRPGYPNPDYLSSTFIPLSIESQRQNLVLLRTSWIAYRKS